MAAATSRKMRGTTKSLPREVNHREHDPRRYPLSVSNLTRYVGDKKICSSCDLAKTLDCYEPSPKYTDGYRGQCRDCRREYAESYNARTVEQRAAYQRKRYLEKREEILARNKEWYEANKDARKEKQAAWYAANKDRAAQTTRARKLRGYGLTVEDYEIMFRAQGGTCPICLEALPNGESASVDHCHRTGKVRGLLHRKCNAGLGMFKDDAQILRRALKYLDET